MQKDFFGAVSVSGPGSTLTMTSAGRTSGMRRDLSITGEDPHTGASNVERDRILEMDVMSTTSAANKDHDINEATSKVQHFFDANSR